MAAKVNAISFVSNAQANNTNDPMRHAALFLRSRLRSPSALRSTSRAFRNAPNASAKKIVTIESEAAETQATGSMGAGCRANIKAANADVQYSNPSLRASQKTDIIAATCSTTDPKCHPQECSPNNVKFNMDH